MSRPPQGLSIDQTSPSSPYFNAEAGNPTRIIGVTVLHLKALDYFGKKLEVGWTGFEPAMSASSVQRFNPD